MRACKDTPGSDENIDSALKEFESLHDSIGNEYNDFSQFYASDLIKPFEEKLHQGTFFVLLEIFNVFQKIQVTWRISSVRSKTSLGRTSASYRKKRTNWTSWTRTEAKTRRMTRNEWNWRLKSASADKRLKLIRRTNSRNQSQNNVSVMCKF